MPALPWLRRRSTEPELLDDPTNWDGQVAGAFAEIEWTNRWFGALGSLRRALRPLLPAPHARILDVGTGTGVSLYELGTWARRLGAEWQLVGMDLRPELLRIGLGGGVTFRPCVGDALDLPFAPGSFDAVMSLQTLHHFADDRAVAFIGEMIRVSRGMVVISELRRGLIPYLGARSLATFAFKDRMTRHDGPLSVRKAFTAPELKALCRRAGGDDCSVRRYGPFRLLLSCRVQ